MKIQDCKIGMKCKSNKNIFEQDAVYTITKVNKTTVSTLHFEGYEHEQVDLHALMKLKEFKMTFTRIKNDVNGNGRLVIHFLELMTNEEMAELTGPNRISQAYDIAISKAKKHGGKKYHNKGFGGGIVFTAYESELTEIIKRIKGE